MKQTSALGISSVFSRYKKIPEQAFHDYLYFYKVNFNEIQQLHFDEYIEIKFSYLKALYHLDKIALFHKQAEFILAELLNYKEFSEFHKHIYEEILFLKAQILIEQSRPDKSIQILKALHGLNSTDPKYKKTLIQILFIEQQRKLKKWNAVVVIILLVTIIISCLHFLIVAPFYSQYSDLVLVMRNISFISGIGLLLVINYHALKNTKSGIRDKF
ncbi:MAG: hypothetical protein M3Q56_00270 [Bacteroidota bacterium]|nr:hypothetical protein [Bacteroidota bacterium]